MTFRRPEIFPVTLRLAAAQTLRPKQIVVVDNEASAAARAAVEAEAAAGVPVTYVAAPENLGPAGGTALGMEIILERASDDDWITRLDDDLEHMDVDVFEELLRFAVEQRTLDPAVGAVGAVGSRYDWRTGRLERISDEEIEAGPVDVDYVGTNNFPAFNVAAVRDVGVFDRRLFYGSSEVAYGLTLRTAGYRIVADPVLWLRLGRRSAATAGPRWGLRPPNWRRYYSLRNQIHILRSNGHSWTALKISVTRGLAKPIANMVVTPRSALQHLRLNAKAVVDGWRGRLGRTIEPW